MEQILEKLETLIDDIERDSQLTRDEIHEALVKLKTEIDTNAFSEYEETTFTEIKPKTE